MKLSSIRSQSGLRQSVSENQVIEALEDSYLNYSFSTFPYICHNMNSKQALEHFNSGNCIALSLGVQRYLKRKFNIISFLIPASIPRKFAHHRYLKISHVALAIPIHKNEYFIADPAFYFLNPARIVCKTTATNSSGIVFSKDIYHKETQPNLKDYTSIEVVHYRTKYSPIKQVFNSYQTIPGRTFSCQCYFESDSSDQWEYFLVEILNPDEAISTFFINIRRYPFITTCVPDKYGICTLEHMVRFSADYIILESPLLQNQRQVFPLDLYKKNPRLVKLLNYVLWNFCNDNIDKYLEMFQKYSKQLSTKQYYFRM